MNSVSPGVPERLYLFRFPGDMIHLSIFHIPGGGGPLKIGVKFYPIGRINVNALDFSPKALSFCQRRHDL